MVNETGSVSGYLQEQMLIAMPSMSDPNFSRSVTLLCQHNEHGAIGITVNRQSGFTLGDLFNQLNISCQDESIMSRQVMEGGPVSPDHGFVLHSPQEGYGSSIRLNDDIMVTTSRDVLVAIANDVGPDRYLVALGYAGWGDGQLEWEMRQNAWLSVPADKDILFESALQKRWENAISKLGIRVSDLHEVGGHA
jgi:putative transcriptional regulator